LPAVKRSHYGWLIATYFFVGGLAGAAQVIGQVAELFGSREDEEVVRSGRYLALLGSLVSPLLLIRDLHTPSRWYNMLRIFRPTSPMSIGSWTLAAFGTLSGLAAFAEAIGRRRLASVFGLPAAGLGMLMSTYTGVLLAATSTPLWAVAYRHLPALFGATAVASASAAMSLLLARSASPPRLALRRLDRLALVAGLVQLAAAISAEREWKDKGVFGPVETSSLAWVDRGVLQLGIGVPLLVHTVQLVSGRRSNTVSLLAALVTLVGAYLERAMVVLAGNRSADRAEDYLRVSR
jgi:formate-dependent nitrite reductase membrane component NrfD